MTPEERDPHSKSADAVHESRPVEAQYVRGARPGGRILWILLLSAGAAAVLLLGMWMLTNGGFASQNDNTGQQTVDAAAFDDNAGEIPSADAPTTATGEPTSPPAGEAANVNPPTVNSTTPAPQ